MGALLERFLSKSAESRTVELVKRRLGTYGLRVERYTLEELSLKNMAYFSGKQHFYIVNGQLFDATHDLPEHAVIYKVNLTRSSLMRASARAIQNSPQMRAVPPRGDMRSRAIAETTEKVAAHQRQVTKFEERAKNIGTIWCGVTGSVFYKTTWDDKAGDPERYYYEKGPDGKKTIIDPLKVSSAKLRQMDVAKQFEDYHQGEVSLGVESIFATFWDWSSRDLGVDGCDWMATRHFVDTEKVAEAWSIDPDDLESDADTTGFYNYEEAVAFMNSSNFYPISFGVPEEKRGRRCMYVDMYQRPSRQFPKGRRIVMAGPRILVDGKNPYAAARDRALHIPLIKQDWAPHPGRFIGCSLVEDLTNPQFNMNDSGAKLLEFLRVFGAPATFVGSNSGLDPEKQTIDPGAVYQINEASRGVVFAPVPQMPPAVVAAKEMCQNDMMMLASQSDVDGSKLPGQIRSGSGLDAMASERYIALTHTSKCAAIATRDVTRNLLSLGQLFYTDPRVLGSISNGNSWDFATFSGADLTHDVRLVGDYGDITDPSTLKAQIADYVQIGALQPQTDRFHSRLVVRSLKLGSSEEMLDVILEAMKNQEREIQLMIADPERYGQRGFPVRDFEDHEVEYKTCVRFMYSEQFNALPPEVAKVIAAHAKMHQIEWQKQQMQQLQMQAMAQGTPGQPGQPSAPRKSA